MTKPKDRSNTWLLIGLAAAVGAGAWAAVGYAAAEDLRERIKSQRSRLEKADKVRLKVLELRRRGGVAPAVRPGAAAGDPVAFLTQTARAAGIVGTQLKGITPIATTSHEGVIEKGFNINLADIERKSLIQYLVQVETLRPSYRTRELRIRRFTPEGKVAGASAVIVYHEKESEEKK
jgi:hypothetical protein